MPSTAKLPHVDRVVERLAKMFEAREFDSRDSAPHYVTLGGPPGSGRSTAITQLGQRLTCTVLVMPPSRGLDTPLHALAQCASSLRERGVNGVLDPIFDPGTSLDVKIAAATAGFKEASPCVLLMDVPDNWTQARYRDDDGSYTSDRGRRVYAGLIAAALEANHSLVVAGPSDSNAEDHISLVPRSSVDFLASNSRWGTFDHHATRLADLLGEKVPYLTPLALRVCVALVALGHDPERVARSAEGGYPELQRILAEELPRHQRLDHVWRTLAIARFAVPNEVLETLERKLDDDERALLRNVLLLQGADGYLMHPSLRNITWGATRKNARAHELLALACKGHAKSPRERHRDTVFWLESLHHYAGAGKVVEIEDAPDVSYWTSLGRHLSFAKDFEGAVSAFRRAVAHRATHAYAHEYLAYNLDRLGKELPAAEASFREAVALEPNNPWWNRRLILALLRRGKIEAANGAWLAALANVDGADEPDRWLQQNLFVGVAEGFLQRGELDYASRVVELVRPARRCPELHELSEQLAHRQDSERLQTSLFPESIPFAHRWEGPHLDADFEPVAWYPGYIVSAAGAVVVVELGEPPEGDGDPQVFVLELPEDQFRAEAGLMGRRRIPVHAHVEMHVDDQDERVFLIHTPTRQRSTANKSDLLANWPGETRDETSQAR